MKITSKGQVTIPIDIRERLKLFPDTEVEFEIVGNTARLRKARNTSGRGANLVAAMRGKANSRYSTDEIMALTRGR